VLVLIESSLPSTIISALPFSLDFTSWISSSIFTMETLRPGAGVVFSLTADLAALVLTSFTGESKFMTSDTLVLSILTTSSDFLAAWIGSVFLAFD